MLGKTDNGFNTKNLMLSDKLHFHLTSVINKQNWCCWAPSGDNPPIIHEKTLHNPYVTVWGGVSVWGIVGLFFFSDDINAEQYVNITETFLVLSFSAPNENYVEHGSNKITPLVTNVVQNICYTCHL